MFGDPFRSQYPIDWAKVQEYRQSTLIGKNRSEVSSIKICKRNGRIISRVPKFNLYQSYKNMKQRYGIYGPNCVIYLVFMCRLSLLMFISSVLVAVPLMAINLSGNSCAKNQYCIQGSYIYLMSIFNCTNSTNLKLAQVAVWLVLSIIICLYFGYLRTYAIQTYKQINNQNITQADFSVIVRRIPENSTLLNIQNLFTKQIFNIVCENNQELSKIQVSRQLQIWDVLMLKKMKIMQQQYKKQFKLFKKSIRQNSYENFESEIIQYPTQFSGTAIVIFKSIKANDFINKILRRNLCDKLVELFLPFLDPRTQLKIGKQHVSIYRAPEPSDILWSNLGYTERYRIRMKIIFTILTLLILGASGVICYLISLFDQKYSNGGKNIWMSIVSSVIVFLFNLIIQKLLILSVENQKLDTKTNLMIEQLRLLVFHQSINLGFFSIVVPLIIYYPDLHFGVAQADFPTVITTIICFKTFLNTPLDFMIEYFNLKSIIWRLVIAKGVVIKIQSQANELCKGVQMQIQQKNASIIQFVWFGFIFGIVSPVCIVVSAIGLGMFSLKQQILFNSKYSIPSYGKNRFNKSFMNIISFIPLLIGLSNLLLHNIFAIIRNQEIDPKILAVIVANVVLGAVNFIIPWQQILQKFDYNIQSNSGYCRQNMKFQLTYFQANPENSVHPQRLYQKSVNQRILSKDYCAFTNKRNLLYPIVQTSRNLNKNSQNCD